MFEKKDIIYSATMGVCLVKDITKLSADKRAPIPYYVLKPIYDKEKTSYIPVDNHEVELRTLISKEDAEIAINKIKLELIENNTDDIISKDISDVIQLIKSMGYDDNSLGEIKYVCQLSDEMLVEKLKLNE